MSVGRVGLVVVLPSRSPKSESSHHCRRGTMKNTLYYGDNLEVLRRYIKDETVDLVYLDPPFKSNQDYNVLFAEKTGKRSAAQIRAFEDTWRWDEIAERTFAEVVEAGGKVSQALQAFRTFLGENDMMAYLAMMAPRLVELRRVLKPTGSIYLHCDPTASHYLKMLMDAVFGPTSFRNEIVWKRQSAHNDARRKFADVTDSILYYVRSSSSKFYVVRRPLDPGYVASFYRHKSQAGRVYRLSDLRSPNPRPNLTYDYKGYKPHPNGWAVCRERMEQLDREGRLEFPKKKTGRIQLRRYLDENPGAVVPSLWDDILPLHGSDRERLGYPTQKPESLLERILLASTVEGDLVLDPFCGCGTTIAAAQKLHRHWIGIDITHLAISLMKHRLKTAFESSAKFEVFGEPADLEGAAQLAEDDRFQFQFWALGLVGARPTEEKRGADKGIDGRLYFHDEGPSGKTKQMIFSVKSGKTSSRDIRDLIGVLDREKAEMGVFLTLQNPSRDMKKEAVTAGFYESPWGKHPRVQILTIKELLEGKQMDAPPLAASVTLKAAPKAKAKGAEQGEFFNQDPTETRGAVKRKKR